MGIVMKKEDIEIAALNYDSRFVVSKGFIAGAEWRINSVWKDASIEPTEKKMLVILDRIGDMWECDYLTDPMPNYAWKVFVKEAAVLRWAYKEDLLPNKEE